MIRWLVKFNQKYNGAVSTAYVSVETQFPHVREAIDAFDEIGYVNARVLSIRMLRDGEWAGADEPQDR